MEIFEQTLQDFYLPEIDLIIKKHFPKYIQKLNNTPQHERKGIKIFENEDEVIELHRRWKEERDYESRNLLIYSQLKLTCYYTKKFFQNNGTKISAEDLLGYANEILVNLMDTYDPYKDKTEEEIENGEYNSLPSYVRNSLFNYLNKELKDSGLMIRLPHNQIINITKYRKALSKFENRYGREPYDGEYIEFSENDNFFKVTFEISENRLKYEKMKDGAYVLIKYYKMQNSNQMVSGNTNINEEEDELFDLMESDYSVEVEDEKQMIHYTINSVLEKLDERERESIVLQYQKNTPIKDIPSLLKPNYECKKEMKRLKETSENKITIYIEKNGKLDQLSYNVIANYHVEETEDGEIKSDVFVPISHRFHNIATNFKRDRYEIGINNVKILKIMHEGHKYHKKLKYKYDGNILTFNVEYVYGDIFTSQTFLNKQKRLFNKLRKQLKHLKPKIYE